jgi:hypothetical protein
VSALLLHDSKPRQALDRALQKGKILLSFAALAELYEVLNRRRFRRYVDEEDIDRRKKCIHFPALLFAQERHSTPAIRPPPSEFQNRHHHCPFSC